MATIGQIGGNKLADTDLRSNFATTIEGLKADDPAVSTTTSTTFIDTVSQTDGKILATKKTLPTAAEETAGITKVTDFYSTTGTSAVDGKAVFAAIKSIDSSDVAISTQYVSKVAINTSGKLEVTRADLPTSLPASDVPSWAKASSKPSYTWDEISSKPSSMPASDVYDWAKASTKPSYSFSEITDTTSVELVKDITVSNVTVGTYDVDGSNSTTYNPDMSSYIPSGYKLVSVLADNTVCLITFTPSNLLVSNYYQENITVTLRCVKSTL